MTLTLRPASLGCLHSRDLVLAEAFADKIKAGGERCVPEGSTNFPREGRHDCCGQGFFRICDLGLCPGAEFCFCEGFRTPAAEYAALSLKRPASETLHNSRNSHRQIGDGASPLRTLGSFRSLQRPPFISARTLLSSSPRCRRRSAQPRRTIRDHRDPPRSSEPLAR